MSVCHSGFPQGIQTLENESGHGKVMELENPEKGHGNLKMVMENLELLHDFTL